MKTKITTPEALIAMFGPMTDDELAAVCEKLCPGASDILIRSTIEKWWDQNRLCRTSDNKISIKVVLFDKLTFGDAFGDANSLEEAFVTTSGLSMSGKLEDKEIRSELLALAAIWPLSIALLNALPIEDGKMEVALLTLLKSGELVMDAGEYHLPTRKSS